MPTREEQLQWLDTQFVSGGEPQPVTMSDMRTFLKQASVYHKLASLATDEIAKALIQENNLETTEILAGVTYEELIDIGLTKGHARALSQHMGGYGDLTVNKPTGRQAEQLREKQEAEDAKSVAQSRILSKSNATEIASAMNNAFNNKDRVDKLNGGDHDTPTVKQTMVWVGEHCDLACKHQLSIETALEQIKADCTVNITPFANTPDDHKYHSKVKASLTTTQWKSMGQSENLSAITLVQNVINAVVEKPRPIMKADMNLFETMGTTWSAAAVPSRLTAFEERLLEVRYSRAFDLQTAVEALLEVVHPMPALIAKVIQKPAAATHQDAMDELLVDLRNYARAAQPRDKGKGKGKGMRGSGKGNNTGSTNNTPTKQVGRFSSGQICWQFKNTGHCMYGSSCKFSHGQSQKIQTNATQMGVNTLAQQMSNLQQQMQEMQIQNYNMMANMTAQPAGEQQPSECRYPQSACPWNTQVNGAILSKVNKRMRAPTEEQALKKIMSDSPQVTAPNIGAIIDGATDEDIIAGKDRQYCSSTYQDNSTNILTVNGNTNNSESGILPMGIFKPLTGPVLSTAKRSLAALHKLTAQGYTYVQKHRAAGLIKEGIVYECPPEGNFFRLPVSSTQHSRAAEMRLAEAKFTNFAKERARSQAAAIYKRLHTPKCLICPDDSCNLGDIHRKQARRKKVKPTGSERGLVLGLDFITDMPKSVNGNTCGLNITESEHDLGCFIPLPNMSGMTTLNAFKEGVTAILKQLPADKQFIARVHSDADKSIIGADLMNYLRNKHWWQTTTEGYDHNANSRVENRNGSGLQLFENENE